MLTIQIFDKNLEPFDATYANSGDEILFFYGLADAEQDTLDGTERFVWDFDALAATRDQLVQTLPAMKEPVPLRFFRVGARRVTLRIERGSALLFTAQANFTIYDFPVEIEGADFVAPASQVTYRVVDNATAQQYQWFVNGTAASQTKSMVVDFAQTRKAVLVCRVTNGSLSREYTKTILSTPANVSTGKRYETNVTPRLTFFNKEGDNLNFELLPAAHNKQVWDGDMLFNTNSTDTYKTVALYIAEKVAPIAFADAGLSIDRFQLFNQTGMQFQPKCAEKIFIERIEVVTRDSDFYSKWLYAPGIQLQVPLGSEVLLDDFFEVALTGETYQSQSAIADLHSRTGSGGRTYTVVGNKQDAVMVLTTTANKEFTGIAYRYGTWKNASGKTVTVPQGYLAGANLIQIYDAAQLSNDWNEHGFQSLLYDKKKLSIVGSKKNNGMVTVDYLGDDATNRLATKFRKTTSFSTTFIQTNFGLSVTLNLKTSKVFLSNSPVDFLPAASGLSMNRKDILVWQKVGGKDVTPPLLRKNSGFRFEQPDPQNPLLNLTNIFKVREVGTALDVLGYQSDDESDQRLVLGTGGSLAKAVVTLTLNGKSVYNVTEGRDWYAHATNPVESATRLAYYLNTNLVGISAIGVGREVWVHAQRGYVLAPVTAPAAITVQAGVLLDNNPRYGIVDDAWTLLDAYANGYVHYKKQQGILYVGYFDNAQAVWYPLPATKKVVWGEPTTRIEYEQNLIAYAYSLDTSVTLEQAADATVTTDALAQKFVDNYRPNLLAYGIDLALVGSEVQFARRYAVADANPASDYVALSCRSHNPIALTDRLTSTESIMVREALVAEDATQSNHSELWRRKIIIKKIDFANGFNLNINGIDLPVNFDNVASNYGAVQDEILDVQATLLDWGNQRFQNPTGKSDYVLEVGRRYHEVLESMGVLVWLEKSLTSYVQGNPKYDTIVLESRFPNVPVTYEVFNTYQQHKILHTDFQFFDMGTVLTVTVNKVPYRTPYAGTIPATLAAWIVEYGDTLLELGIDADALGDVLRVSTHTEKTSCSVQVAVGKTPVSGSLFYVVTPYRTGKSGIVLSGTEVSTLKGDFQSLGFATGMIVNVSGCKFTPNNKEYNVVLVDSNRLGLSYQGATWDSSDGMDYVQARSGFKWATYDQFTGTELPALTNALRLSTRSFIRQPREGYDHHEKTHLSVRWLEQTDNDLFLYDFSGTQLGAGVTDQGIYQYNGVHPLNATGSRIFLNAQPNRDLGKRSDPEFQQTVFDRLVFDLDLIDDVDDVNFLPTPLQVFIGFNTQREGVSSRTLLLHRHEDVGCTLRTEYRDNAWQNVVRFDAAAQSLSLDNSTANFLTQGFKVGQLVHLSGVDYLNTANQRVFRNSGFEGIVTDVTVATLRFAAQTKPLVDEESFGSTRSLLPPFRLKNSAFNITLTVQEELIGSFRFKGETESEDERLGITLNNLGYNIKAKDVFIFKEYDILEAGVDWGFLNAKRKEMLLVYPEIYNYLSAYKALINGINFFGYNDLTLNEYYLNIDAASPKFNQLQKIEIPDIFDATVEGWHETDYLKKTLPNESYIKTKLFNLTYRITDFEGNIILGYSLDEVITKLLGLKTWVKEEVMMLGTNIKDLTGVGSTVYTTNVALDVKFSRKFHIRESLSPVDFAIEAYLQPVENNSRTFMVHLTFTTHDPATAPDFFHVKITTYRKVKGKLRSVQLINELRTTYQPYNFAADQKIDQYLIIEVSCDNGYGANYSRKRSYSLANGTYIETLL